MTKDTDELDDILDKLLDHDFPLTEGVGEAKQAIQALIAKECNKARIDEIKRYREAMTFAHITPSIYAAERIPELLSEE